MKHNDLSRIIICSLLLSADSFPMDNAHFYRATNFLWRPELVINNLSTLDISFAGGMTTKGFNGAGKKVDLFNIYGCNNMHDLGVGVPKSLTNSGDLILTQLALTPSRDGFANLSIKGKFSILELNALWTQHLFCGVFFQAHLPVRRFSITNICFKDCSPTDDATPNQATPIWQIFLQQFGNIMRQHCINVGPFHGTGVGDLTLLLGGAYNYNDTVVIDFIDLTGKAGILIPTGKKEDPNKLFSLPFGYNGHIGVPLALDLAFGSYEWLLIGAHFDAVIFVPNTRTVRIKTAPFQQGILFLAETKVHENLGTVWTAGAYAKADHFCRGISLLLGYTFARQNSSHLTTDCSGCFPALICNDERFHEWHMHTVHFGFEYDHIFCNSDNACHAGLFANIIAGGKRIWNTQMGGVYVGCDIGWTF